MKKNKNKYFNANLLAKNIGIIFFKDLVEYEKVNVDYDDDLDLFSFIITFTTIYPETIVEIEKFMLFLGYEKDSWSLENSKINGFNYFCCNIMLSNKTIEKLLDDLKLRKDSEKYNL